MSKPHVTITLGHSGQKVVRRRGPQTVLRGAHTDSQPLSISKRYAGERFENDADSSFLSMNKRQRGRGDVVTRGPVHDRVDDVRLGRNDLRLKLLRKKLSKRKQSEVEERKKMDLREKMSRSRTIESPPERRLLRRIPPTRSSGEMMQVDSARNFYSSHHIDGSRQRSPHRVFKAAPRERSPPRYIDEPRRVPSTRIIQDSRVGQIVINGFSDPSRPPRPAPSMVRANPNSDNPAMVVPPPSGSTTKGSYVGDRHLTVGSLLLSLGLAKYDILFRADEVDMDALKQMGDRDLKELGLPMGPRKKILLAVTPPSKRKPQL